MNSEKLIKNEQIIRDHNRAAGRALKKYFGAKKEIMETPIEFVCECSDINCREPISVSIAEYERLHKRRNRFLIIKGHNVPHIEKTIERKGKTELVEKPSLAA